VTLRTWQIELAVVASVLAGVNLLVGSAWLEWLGAAAVLAGFAHAQVADRLAERQAIRTQPDVECHRLATRYFVSKEALWCAYFMGHGSWSALVGCAVFLAYPIWRSFWRLYRPIKPLGSKA